MSKYTTEVRFICETLAECDMSQGYGKVSDVLDKSWDKVFDFDFPIFDEEYREVLCKKILMHYYTREIAFETVGMWKLKLQTMMNEVMPYYNQMYESTLLKFNPLYDADYSKTHEGQNKGSGTERGNSSGRVEDSGNRNGTQADTGYRDLDEGTWNVFSDTPQGALTNVENETYLTDARKITHNAEENTRDNKNYNENNSNDRVYNDENNRDTSFDNTDEYIEHIVGKFPGKTYASVIREFRENFLNVDVDVINSLSSLFFKLW